MPKFSTWYDELSLKTFMGGVSMVASKRLRGKVAWFDDIAGKGVVRGDDGELYIVHYSAIKSSSKYKTLKKDQQVEFALYKGGEHSEVASLRIS
ncbi:MAG: hypothetical protein COV44_10705 [Deltaproteobacteria bacterium CG11_big_fil_rev_8_21_14_0_20_45_16]|nr:MAG: hypothetical protein COV44_10705 [Deltaproteobacteria bacterium CG11_big_fil_rev_8_21_14_0_20_45_16]